ncbi:MAG: HD domain-containing protein, partial [Clostridia bacterium]
MNEYFENLNETIKEYFKVLSDEIPDFLYDYINTPAMQRIGKIGCGCGTDYTKIFNNKFFYSNLDHSIGVALIIWNFTKDKKRTIAGLFHDISTPVFKHCIDFMNGDHETQESTEELTTYMIKNSKEIMELLERDNIKVNEVDDYHIYPIADNDTPKLSADRLEYTLANGLYFKVVWDVQKIKEIYSNIEIQINEDGIR